MQPPYPDRFNFEAAHGWLLLGRPEEAELELVRLHPGSRKHPRFLLLSCRILLARKKFSSALRAANEHILRAPEEPEGWIHRAYCLHELTRTREAFEALLPAARRFPRHHLIAFNLACYCCHLNWFQEALLWVNRSLAFAKAEG
jgi:predicted Zn-dependent protease